MTQTRLVESETSSLAVTDDVLARTEYRGPPWNLSILDEFELVTEDGVPMDTYGHGLQMALLIDVVRREMIARGRTDYFVGGNMFVYYTPEQAQFVATHKPKQYRPFVGPDFLFVDQPPRRKREVWKVWEEDNRYPDIIVELLSPSTAHIDKGIKKKRYAEIFGTGEYYLYKPGSDRFTAYHLKGGRYRKVTPDRHGFVRSPKLGLWLGLWKGVFRDHPSTWLRLYDDDGELIPTSDEMAVAVQHRARKAEKNLKITRQRLDSAEQRADSAEQRADSAEQRADAAEAEIARLRALLGRTDG